MPDRFVKRQSLAAATLTVDGCWEITGQVGPTTLTFVTFVIKQGT